MFDCDNIKDVRKYMIEQIHHLLVITNIKYIK